MDRLSVYIHIPFCIKKCAYCDFLSAAPKGSEMQRYKNALIYQIRSLAKLANEYDVYTVFIGGGTPSIYPSEDISDILFELENSFEKVRRGSYKPVEITIECNPGTLDYYKLKNYRLAGINRLSMGLQSADNDELKLLGRIHTYESWEKEVDHALRAGFTNINTDLISGLYNQSLDKFATSLEKVERHGMKHISVYSLIIEEGTPFYEKYSVDKLSDEEYEKWEEEDRRIYDYTREILAANGYRQYEISNYAKPGYECLHNLVYWNRGDYIGIGIGAASMIHNIRFSTISSLLDYISLNEKACDRYFEKIFNDVSRLSPNEQMNESIMLGFRKNDGIDLESFDTKFSTSFLEKYKEQVCKWREEGMLKVEGGRVYLTEKGQSISNMIIVDFMD